ncbi:hypothetical protein H6P81_015405 [Aristolochia fimbriata]|uniref:TMEM205-like domain-containing protein n=1 Tax=Aristolochia fimbriata TaxID=158543 RepID=A0AAV7E5F6_ARIFI|nr:hypothetical protein H6P81_015405 [Aristolochia fimbriata]
MMNVVALTLLIATLSAASVWSPPPQQKEHPKENLILKEGHRVIVVEYERDVEKPESGKPLPEPSRESGSYLSSGIGEEFREKLKETVSVLPNLGQGLSTPEAASSPPTEHHNHGVKELVCDMYGKCKEKISSVIGKGKDKATDTISSTEEEIKDGPVESVKNKGKEYVEKGKLMGEASVEKAKGVAEEVSVNVKKGGKDAVDKAKDVGQETVEKSKNVGQDAIDKAKSTGEKLAEIVGEAGKRVLEKQRRVGEKMAENVEGVKNAVGEKTEQAMEKTKSKGEDLAGKVSEKAKEMGETGSEVAEEVKKNLTEIVHRAWDVAYDAWMYLVSPENVRSVMGLVHLLAFATTYGICIWVTFISSHVLARALSRQQFGVVQSRLYPVYFRSLAYGTGLSWLGHLFDRKGRVGNSFQSYNLLTSLAVVLANMLFLEPRASKVMFERLKLEKEEGRGRDIADMVAETVTTTTTTTVTAVSPPTTTFNAPSSTATTVTREREAQETAKSRVMKLNRKLKSLNTYSSFLNVLTLMGLSWHLVNSVQWLHRCLLATAVTPGEATVIIPGGNIVRESYFSVPRESKIKGAVRCDAMPTSSYYVLVVASIKALAETLI